MSSLEESWWEVTKLGSDIPEHDKSLLDLFLAQKFWSCSGDSNPSYNFILFLPSEKVFVSCKANICKKSEENATGDKHNLVLMKGAVVTGYFYT